ncbi:Asp23/Gls24 family envelope stress response protein [Bacillus sp. H-16]|uniref:Asp23/Gls24 family envelope stress response protein n=1 Tax=Alteribacter salitolerans TaxID=2912333 RepID=UPI0019627263|nr:Asp23/Gls24 family envelope stress response protein [Alteribacter salitolerans]MBM7095899.1 Asp23/Gls24 family envelope stress response protein [Alteribacter salitolerans]
MKKNVHILSHEKSKGDVSISIKALRQYVYHLFKEWTSTNPFLQLVNEDQRLKDSLSSVKLRFCGGEEKEKLSITLEVVIEDGYPIHSVCRKLQVYMADHLYDMTSVAVQEVNVRVVSCNVRNVR